MKKVLMMMLGASLLMSSCGTYEAEGAYTGSMFGNMLGSAIGGIAGGWRGEHIGSLVGTLGGAAAGAAIGAAADNKREARMMERQAAMNGINRQSDRMQRQHDDSGFDAQMRGDDRITFMGSDNRAAYGEALVIRNAGVYEAIHDGVLTRGERCEVIFEIANTTDQPAYNVFPLVEETTGNKHIHISPNMRVESIAPHQAIRYTATLTADQGLRNGQIQVRVGVALGSELVKSQRRLFTVPTSKHALN